MPGKRESLPTPAHTNASQAPSSIGGKGGQSQAPRLAQREGSGGQSHGRVGTSFGETPVQVAAHPPFVQTRRRKVQPDRILAALEQIAARLDLEVRYEAIGRASATDPKGGLCRIRGRHVVVVDVRLSATDKVAILARALAQFGTGSAPLPHEARRAIDLQAKRLAAERGLAVAPSARGPGGWISPGVLRPLARIKPKPE